MVGKAVDSHCHVFDTTLFPYAADAAYRPPPQEAGTKEQLSAVLDAHGISHALLVNPAELRDAGVIGIRLDLVGDGIALIHDPSLERLLARVRAMRWLVQVQCERDQLHEAAAPLQAARVPLVFDHCGRPDAERGVDQPGFRALLEFGREGHFVKLSGPFRFFNAFSPRAETEPFVRALIEWGSDWPFLRLPVRMDYGPVLANLHRWFPDERDRHEVLWETPARLFGFD